MSELGGPGLDLPVTSINVTSSDTILSLGQTSLVNTNSIRVSAKRKREEDDDEEGDSKIIKLNLS